MNMNIKKEKEKLMKQHIWRDINNKQNKWRSGFALLLLPISFFLCLTLILTSTFVINPSNILFTLVLFMLILFLPTFVALHYALRIEDKERNESYIEELKKYDL